MNRCLESLNKLELSPPLPSPGGPGLLHLQQQQPLLQLASPGSNQQLSPILAGGGVGGGLISPNNNSTNGSTTTPIPQHMITAGTRKDCVRLRGLPYEAQVEHILEFLGDYAKNIVYQGVHMVYNAQVIFLAIVSACI